MSLIEQLEPVKRLDQDLKIAARVLGDKEAQFLVSAYYLWQDNRIRSANQIRTLEGEPNSVLNWALGQSTNLENQIKLALDHYARHHPMGEWLYSVDGVGPVIAAGFLAHLSETPPPSVGHWWAFAGLDPSKTWNKGEKRPWNAELKTLCWKLGESFVKVSGKETAVYGQWYAHQKAKYVRKNEEGGFKDRAAQILETKKIGKSTDAYKAYSIGKLPKAHIHAMAKRWAVKLFMAHYWERAYKLHHNEQPPMPYPLQILGHAHYVGEGDGPDVYKKPRDEARREWQSKAPDKPSMK